MVTAFMKLCLCVYLYYNVQTLVTANISSSHNLGRNTWEETSIKHDENGTDKNLIDTPGCSIPNIWAENWIVEANDCKDQCGTRAVFIERVYDKNIIKYIIDEKLMKEIFQEFPYECCAQFAYVFVKENTLRFTDCVPFVHGTHMVLQQEIVTITCKVKGNSTDVYYYKDAYILVQKLVREAKKNDGNSWNVLLIGMDSMSRGRAIQSMPKLVKYFEKNGWLDYRAFQKAESNTYPNLMITYTGRYKNNMFSEACNHDKHVCNDLFIWSKFKLSGFITAYVEDELTHTVGHMVTSQPTDHYPRLLFSLGSHYQGNIHCLRSIPCSHHILDYAYQFARTYKEEKFFGSFWTTKYSHDPINIPTLLQNKYIELFENLDGLGTLNNTIIFFLSDHGIRYGPLRIPAVSYYDTRLPMLYMWFPHSFRKRFKDQYHNLELNQHRLTTHSDLHSTFWDILKLSDENVTIIPPEYCPSCGSLLEEKSEHRRCQDMNVSVRWCSCYVLNNVSSTDIAATAVPEFLLHYIIYELDKALYQLKRILRHQWFRVEYDHEENVIYYVIAIEVIEDDKQFEGVIKQHKSGFDIVLPVVHISPDTNYFDTSKC